MDMQRLLERASWDFIPLDEAKLMWAAYRALHGLSEVAVPLLTMPDGNAKMVKTAKNAGVNVCGLALAPANGSSLNTCRYKTEKCELGCLTYAGMNVMPLQQQARIVKTEFLAAEPGAFYTLLMWEIGKAREKFGRTLRVRLNMLSDLTWETLLPEIFERYPDVRFYDYTKWTFGKRVTPPNYDLTYSASERTSDERIARLVDEGARVAVVFGIKRGEDMITTWHGMRVVDGDKSDDRYLNGQGEIIGLRAKGRMYGGKPEFAGFVKEVA